MRIKAILSALKQNFLDNFIVIAVYSLIIALIAEIVSPSLSLFAAFVVLFILIMAVYLIISVKPWKLRESEKEIANRKQAENVKNEVAILKKEKALLLEDETSSIERLTKANEKLKRLHEKKRQFADMPLNSAKIDNEIRLAEQWDRDIPSNNLKSARERIKEIDAEIDRKNKKIKSFFTR